jgi:hypothetical protein
MAEGKAAGHPDGLRPWSRAEGTKESPWLGDGVRERECIYGLECRLIAIWRREREKRTKHREGMGRRG